MTTWFISRHPGARQWAEKRAPAIDRHCPHLDAQTLADVQAGDLVIGSLPVHLAAAICDRGARYLNLSLDLPAHARGLELSADELQSHNARLEEFHIEQRASLPSAHERTIHIVLASGENLPNLIPVLAPSLKAERVIILATRAMRMNAERFRHGLVSAGLPETHIRLREGCPDHDLTAILAYARQCANEITTENPQARLVLNLTGGNKLMTIGFQQAFRHCAEIIYCDTEHNRIDYFHPIGQAAAALPVNLLKLNTYLATQGYRLRPETPDIDGLNVRQELTRALIGIAPRHERLIGNLNAAAHHYRANHYNRAHLDLPTSSDEKRLVDLMVDRDLLKNTGNRLSIASDSAASYLGGGWLEEWCWHIGKELEQGESGKRLHANRWGINLKIDPWDQAQIPGRNQYALNELDAAFIHRNRMLLVECKSGVQISERGESQDILNKLETLGKHVGGRLDTKWLLTARRIDRNTQALQRASKYGIRIVKPEQLVDLKSAIYAWMTK